jgi:hypothetical protein
MNDATTWKAKDGRVIPIAELDDVHLGNVIRMLDRQGHCFDAELRRLRAYLVGPLPSGDGAQIAFEQECDAAGDFFDQHDIHIVELLRLVHRLPRYAALCEERDRRRTEGRWSLGADAPDHDTYDPNWRGRLAPQFGVSVDDDLTLCGKGDSV